jgi:hypothetical protein
MRWHAVCRFNDIQEAACIEPDAIALVVLRAGRALVCKNNIMQFDVAVKERNK